MSILLKSVYALNILCFLALSMLYFNRRGIELDLRWQALKVLSLLYWAYSLINLFKNDFTSHFLQIGFAGLNFLSLSILIWTFRTTKGIQFNNIFVTKPPEHICTTGSYRWVRHPYYLSYLMCYFSTLTINTSVYNFGGLLILSVLYLLAIKSEEQLIMKSDASGTYQAYSMRTKRIIPFIF